jgi:hypothetical protein
LTGRNLSTIGKPILNQASFDQSNFGFKERSDLFTAIDLFKVKQQNGSGTWGRDKRKAKSV